MTGDDRLRLIALDIDDLAIVSALVQDAVLKAGDLRWEPRQHRFALAMNRLAWEAPQQPGPRREHQRRRAAMHFERVLSVRSTGLDRAATEQVLQLLAVRFEPRDSPSGEVVLDFAGAARIGLTVECLEAQLADLGPAWSTPRAPRHGEV